MDHELLDYVFVVPEWQRKGITRSLVSKALGYFKQQHNKAWLEVLSHNEAAVSLYRDLGFVVFKEEVSLGLLLK
jgi:ribosomal protein S18 acetylase RimI-like enzyme